MKSFILQTRTMTRTTKKIEGVCVEERGCVCVLERGCVCLWRSVRACVYLRACVSLDVTCLAVSLFRRSRAYMALSTTSRATLALPFTSTSSSMVPPGGEGFMEGLTCVPTTNQHSVVRCGEAYTTLFLRFKTERSSL